MSLVSVVKTEVTGKIFLVPIDILKIKNVMLSVFSHCITTQNGCEKIKDVLVL